MIASELEHNEATLIIELKHKLAPALVRASGGATRPKDIHQYAEQCHWGISG